MKSLDIEFLNRQSIPIEMGGLLQKLGEYKGRQDLYMKQTPQTLETLKQAAIIESTESSNRIEGVTVDAKRFRELMSHPQKPRDRSEAEIMGYRQALSRIHTRPDSFEINVETILNLHKEIYSKTDIPAGVWKKRDNTIEERKSDGTWTTRFIPVPAPETQYYMKELCERFNRLRGKGTVSPLILIPAFVFDFLCIHPFTDGNGRVSRLLTVLTLNQAGYTVGRYISVERLIEESKETYYDVLQKSSAGWQQGNHSLKPWWEYSLGILIGAYGEFESRTGKLIKARGAKTSFVEQAVENMPEIFRISDIERACPDVGRDMIRVVLNKLRKQDRLESSGTGRSAAWHKRGNKQAKRGNKRGNNK
jgi:Fic family protein